jgi:hypothetical protein
VSVEKAIDGQSQTVSLIFQEELHLYKRLLVITPKHIEEDLDPPNRR